MDAQTLLEDLRTQGVTLTAAAGALRYRGRMTPELRETITAHKPALLALLSRTAAPAPVARRSAADFLPDLHRLFADDSDDGHARFVALLAEYERACDAEAQHGQ